MAAQVGSTNARGDSRLYLFVLLRPLTLAFCSLSKRDAASLPLAQLWGWCDLRAFCLGLSLWSCGARKRWPSSEHFLHVLLRRLRDGGASRAWCHRRESQRLQMVLKNRLNEAKLGTSKSPTPITQQTCTTKPLEKQPKDIAKSKKNKNPA